MLFGVCTFGVSALFESRDIGEFVTLNNEIPYNSSIKFYILYVILKNLSKLVWN